MMTDQQRAIERYLRELADGLDALGPVETDEVLLEVRSHLRDAIAEAGGDEKTALARFGSPTALAARILEERGILHGASAVPDAPAALRAAALAVDVAVWAVLLWVFTLPFGGFAASSKPSPLSMALGWAAVAGIVAFAVWWWVRKRRERGHVSIGMRVVGLRRIRIGESTRLVRARDIPGSQGNNEGRVMAALGAALVLLFLAAMVTLAFQEDDSYVEAERQEAVQEAGFSAALVSDLYRQVLAGAPAEELEWKYEAGATDALRDLLARRAAGDIGSCSIDAIYLESYPPPWDEWDVDETYEMVVLVSVSEYRRGSDRPKRFDYRVVTTHEAAGECAWEGGWAIRSVAEGEL